MFELRHRRTGHYLESWVVGWGGGVGERNPNPKNDLEGSAFGSDPGVGLGSRKA